LRDTTFRNARSNFSCVASAPISRAMSMKRFDSAGSSGGHTPIGIIRQITESCLGSACADDRCRRLRCLSAEACFTRLAATRPRIGKAFALCPDERAIGALQVVNPKSNAVVVTEIEFRSVAVQVGSLTWK
jgi:hypothetical protein